ncbi:MAG: oxidative damage protection protein [Gammaproteobacteria bacterium]|nr:MAG: oxidative damage protection protein [Gammaproteobacteria bacterium]RLA14843.1 MAG: oxidative damage protection protein [Gammaproteobacteria bacterium]
MTKTVMCRKLGKEAAALEKAPYPGEMGQRILAEISSEAWDQWVAQQTMLINENRLSMADASSRKFLVKEMENFLFGEGSETPEGFTPPE